MALSAAARTARAKRAAAVRQGDPEAAARARADFARVKREDQITELLADDPIETDEASRLAALLLNKAGVAW